MFDATLTAATANETRARWEADEAAVLARFGNAQPGVSRPDQVAGKTGMEVFEAMFAGELPSPPIGHTLNFVPVHMEPRIAVFQGRPSFAHYNPLGSVHGGWFATLLDSAVGCCIHTALPAGKSYTTVELKINIVKALTVKVPLIRAEGRVIHLGRSMGTAEGRLYGPDGTLYAHASTTCFIFDAPAPK
jgi:uncharacterized protein (TIGR00369 family)